MDKLEKFRREIDKIDADMVKLLEKRWATAKRIGEEKRKKGLEYYDQKREEEVLKKVVGKTSLDKNFIKDVFTRIMEYCRNGESE